jgi:glucose/arabinose dehydrogenase
MLIWGIWWAGKEYAESLRKYFQYKYYHNHMKVKTKKAYHATKERTQKLKERAKVKSAKLKEKTKEKTRKLKNKLKNNRH